MLKKFSVRIAGNFGPRQFFLFSFLCIIVYNVKICKVSHNFYFFSKNVKFFQKKKFKNFLKKFLEKKLQKKILGKNFVKFCKGEVKKFVKVVKFCKGEVKKFVKVVKFGII
jgi:hypothetical protein